MRHWRIAAIRLVTTFKGLVPRFQEIWGRSELRGEGWKALSGEIAAAVRPLALEQVVFSEEKGGFVRK